MGRMAAFESIASSGDRKPSPSSSSLSNSRVMICTVRRSTLSNRSSCKMTNSALSIWGWREAQVEGAFTIFAVLRFTVGLWYYV